MYLFTFPWWNLFSFEEFLPPIRNAFFTLQRTIFCLNGEIFPILEEFVHPPGILSSFFRWCFSVFWWDLLYFWRTFPAVRDIFFTFLSKKVFPSMCSLFFTVFSNWFSIPSQVCRFCHSFGDCLRYFFLYCLSKLSKVPSLSLFTMITRGD